MACSWAHCESVNGSRYFERSRGFTWHLLASVVIASPATVLGVPYTGTTPGGHRPLLTLVPLPSQHSSVRPLGLSRMILAGSDVLLVSRATADIHRSIASKLLRLHALSPMIGAGPSQMSWLACVPCSRSSRARMANARYESWAAPGSGPRQSMIAV